MATVRSLLWSVWVQSGKTKAGACALLESLASGHLDTIKAQGRTMVRTTVNGKSFDYQVPPGSTPEKIRESAYAAWRKCEALADDAALENYLKQSRPNVIRPVFDRVIM